MRMDKTLVKKKGLSLGMGDYTKLLLAMVFVAMVFIPLMRMFSYMDLESVQKVVQSAGFAVSAFFRSFCSSVWIFRSSRRRRILCLLSIVRCQNSV